jgi:hypothetical protein
MALIGISLQADIYSALYTNQLSDANIVVSSSTAQGRTESVLDFNQGEGLNSRDIETAFSWPISAGTVLYVWQPSVEPYPENTYDRATPWDNAGSPGNKLIRGFVLEMNSFGNAKTIQVQRSEDAAFFTPSESPATTSKQVIKAFAFNPPFVAHNVRITSTDGVAWQHGPDGGWNLAWITDPWVEYATLRSAWSNFGFQGAKYIRGLVMPMDTQGIPATITVVTSDGQSVSFTATTPTAVKTTVSFAFDPPIIAHYVQIQMDTETAGVWDSEIRWDFDQYPEIIPEYTPIMELSGPDNKFFQGVKLIADTGNQPVTFQILYDGGQVGPTFTGKFNGKQTLVFSWVPFLAHDIQLVPQTNARIWWGGIGQGVSEWVFEPYPEMATNWTSEVTSLGGRGWQHLRYMDITYLSTTPITINFVVDTGNGSIAPAPITLPSSGGTQTKSFTEVTFNKWKLISFSATSSAPFALWEPDLEVWVKSWGIDPAYRNIKPFGGNASAGAEV